MDSSFPTRSRLVLFLFSLFVLSGYLPGYHVLETQNIPHAQEMQAKCRTISNLPGPPGSFLKREVSDRFEVGTNSTLILNTTMLIGQGNDTHILHGDLYLDKGLVKAIGSLSHLALVNGSVLNLTVINANEAWVTPGLVDIHTHLGLLGTPFLTGAFDANPKHGPVLPWLRNIDGFNTHDDGFQLAIAGGVTSVQVLSGSMNNIGGQSVIVKLRRTSEGSSLSMVVEPPYNLNGSFEGSTRWRHLQQACGQTPSQYGNNRPDAIWALRSAYAEAQRILIAQEQYCSDVEAGLWDSLGEFPENLQFEMLVDVLRSKVKVTSQCQTIEDIDALVRLTNEYKFPVASLQHASEAWLIPAVLNRTWGGSPSVALFATNHRYNFGSYRGSEFAPRVLSDAGIPVVMKSAHPVVNSRYLLQEAQQAHYYGLPPYLALASITSVPAMAVGLDHRIGSLHEGADADVVMWDSNPLQPGATPKYVWIDGALQIPLPRRTDREQVEVGVGKEGEEWTRFPGVPDWEKERKQAIEWEGLPPLTGRKQSGRTIFLNVRDVWLGVDGTVQQVVHPGSDLVNIAVENGRITCVGDSVACPSTTFDAAEHVDLNGGSVSPGLMTFGSQLGLEEIRSEPSTGDGSPFDAFTDRVPAILHDPGAVVKAADTLRFGTRNALTAYRSGVTYGTACLMKSAFGGRSNVIAGVSATFRTGASHAMERGAIIQSDVALHVAIHRPDPFSKKSDVSFQGVVPLVIDVGNADIMATLLILKAEVENRLGSRMRMVFSGAAEAHILAKEISGANVGVILDAKPTVGVWDDHRTLPGPPLTNDTTLVILIREGVKVGLRSREAQFVRNIGFDLVSAMLASNGRIGKAEAYALVSTNLRELLGVIMDDQTGDLVAYTGGSLFETSSKVAAVISARKGQVDIFTVT
ncbi:hypothetical protein DFH07DRAFT_902839 [Mycena maculata]|uniref:Amidohydrolase-related domain-containing protein n=1 Tax=Mycena maculata TaxID=230809 RepID=A0AAD7JHS5_9AGAR|nr:hypothetical protein DFH07DRAFT_902839 [Mycena maculata]